MPLVQSGVNAFNESSIRTAADESRAQVSSINETPDTQPTSGVWDAAKAAFSQDNLFGAALDRAEHPQGTYAQGGRGGVYKDYETIPGFDAMDHIPKGYELDADTFIGAQSPQEVEWRRQYIDRKRQDQQTIANAGKAGFIASLAAGALDPITVASMFLPVAGETRLARAGAMALQAGGTTAAQEAVMHTFDPTRTLEDSAITVGGSAVLGGILGAAFRPKLSNSEYERLAKTIESDPEKALGNVESRVIPDPVKESRAAEESYIAQQMRERAANKEADLVAHLESPEGQAASKTDINAVEKKLQAAISEQSRLASILTEDKSVQVQREIEKLQVPADAMDRLRAKYNMTDVSSVLEKRAIKTVSENRDAVAAQHYAATNVIESLRNQADQFNKVRATESELEQLRYLKAQARDLTGMAEMFTGAEKQAFLRRIAELPKALQPADTGLGVSTKPELAVNQSDSTVGAAAVHATPSQETVADGIKSFLASPIGRASPGGRLLTSPILAVRKLAQRMGNVHQIMEKNAADIATAVPIERKLWKAEGIWQTSVDDRSAAFSKYKERLAQTGERPLSRKEFNLSIANAMRRGDQHVIPEVAQAARETRAKVFDPYWQRAQKLAQEGTLGLPEEAKLHAKSYLMRQYDAAKIKGDLDGWMSTIRNHLVDIEKIDPAEAADIAHSATRNVLGSERGTMDWKSFDDIVPKSGQLKGRTLAIPDSVLEPWLNSDIDSLTHSYLRSMAPTVEIAEEFGSTDMKDQIQEIKDEAAIMMQRAMSNGNNKSAANILSTMESNIKDVAAVRDRLYGIYGQPKDPSSFFIRAGRLLRLNNVWRLLGGATLSHIPDVANVFARYGMTNSLAAAGKLLTSMEAMKMTRSEAHRLGVGLDMAMNTISLGSDFGSHSQFLEQRIGNKIAKAFTIATGETPLVTAVQMMSSVIGQDEILRTAEKVAAGKAVDKNQLIRLASAGLDKESLSAIAAEHAAAGQEVNGLKFGMSDTWKDQKLAQKFELAILKDAHNTTLRPGVLDTPLLMSTELGKTVLQFKSFGFAAMAGVLQPALQGLVRGDPRAFAAIMSLAGAGAMTYYLKQKAAGQPIENENAGKFALEVLDKSNLLGWTGEAIFPALWQLGFRDLSRWSDRTPTETLIGPSIGTVASTMERQIPGRLRGATDAETGNTQQFRRSDLHFIRRTFLPAQNLWWARRGINDVEDSVGDLFDLPGTSNKQRLEAAGQ